MSNEIDIFQAPFSSTRTLNPLPSAFSAVTLPLHASTQVLTILSPSPDFTAVADKVKGEYTGYNKAEFDAAIDARARFLASLPPEQREKMQQMRCHGAKGGWHARYHGPTR